MTNLGRVAIRVATLHAYDHANIQPGRTVADGPASGTDTTANPGSWLGRLLVLIGTSMAFSSAPAEMELVVGIYAYDPPTEIVWSCQGVVTAMERHMSQSLDEEVTLRVAMSEDFDRGPADYIRGAVDFARFPTRDGNWFAHPGVPLQIRAAWRKAMQRFQLEQIVLSWQAEVGFGVVGDFEDVEGGELFAREFRYCAEDAELFARLTPLPGRPAYTTHSPGDGAVARWIEHFNGLEATASGANPLRPGHFPRAALDRR